MRNPYDVLGVPKSASEQEIKRAFRRAAKQHHPDQNREDPKAAERFSELNAAYEILGDTTKRQQFDRGEIGADGKAGLGGGFSGGFGGGGPSADDLFRHFRNMGRGPQGGGGFGGPGGAGAGGFDSSDVFGRMFSETAERARGGQQRPRQQAPQRGADTSVTMTLTIEEIIAGEPKRVRMPTGKDLEIAIPKNVSDGQTVRLRGQGYSSPTGGEAGDCMLTIKIAPHERYRVDGRDLRTRLPVPLADAVLGGPVMIQTPTGAVEMNLPAMTSSGRTLRLKGKGMPGADGAGDLYATVDIQLGSEDDELTALMRRRKGSR
jgi:DnaJ-class molecular chaperone